MPEWPNGLGLGPNGLVPTEVQIEPFSFRKKSVLGKETIINENEFKENPLPRMKLSLFKKEKFSQREKISQKENTAKYILEREKECKVEI